MGRGLDEGTRARLVRAVEAVEARSSVELVIAVRPQAASYLHASLLVGALLSYAALLYMLFAPPIFELVWIALIVAASFAVGTLFGRVAPGLTLRLVGRRRVAGRVLEAARATFVERGVSRTRGRTGVLVYVAQRERRCALVPDIGVSARLPAEVWAELEGRFAALALPRRITAAAIEPLARAIEATGESFERHLPRDEDDINELEDVA
ncbi:MAG: hypothetical protein H6713_15885 [Myxococcales bacterium]|nr:hypothetical protein [Myxococcales bacterium]MCB9751455.1 hypothetical protein [Myxococcales bacterium]